MLTLWTLVCPDPKNNVDAGTSIVPMDPFRYRNAPEPD